MDSQRPIRYTTTTPKRGLWLVAFMALSAMTARSHAQCPELDMIAPNEQTQLFGDSMALDGDLLVVGAFQYGASTNAGAAYVFRRDPITQAWNQEAVLVGNDIANGDQFGWSVAVDGDWVLVGAPQHDQAGVNSGAAYLFRHLGGGIWAQEQKLVPVALATNDSFGTSVGIENGVAAVGAPRRMSSPFHTPGTVFVFRDQGATGWVEDAELIDPLNQNYDWAGTTLLLKGGTLFVSSPYAQAPAVNAGMVVIWTHNGTSWNKVQTLASGLPNAVSGHFGWSLGGDGSQLIIGAPGEDNATQEGAAYIYEQNGSSWVLTDKLTFSAPNMNNWFGQAVAIDGDMALVGMQGFDYGVNGGGAAVLFRRQAGTWFEEIPFTGSGRKLNSGAGRAVALNSDMAFVGDRYADNGASPISSGVVYMHPTAGLRLTSSSTAPAPGQRFTLTVTCGKPGERILIALTEINGKSQQRPVFRSVFGVDYRFAKSIPAPDPVKGVNIGLTAVKFAANGKVVSNQVNIDL